ncbi:YheC/YheD family protein [Paenibacillus thalictri]|uniref:ATP-grasp domain-containing protein n=1 Tax=Paenibacillus thalictri TaxID=2527873 RepID=A0A4V6MSG2_9BACL|nr:YheC/YheD family protein [Paenibacillus thalictri]TBL77393.1 hypothetical protein EYB31_18130 [Paenibacillus thalictri]
MVIGLYKPESTSLSPEWATFIHNEANKQGLLIIFFDSSGIDVNSYTVQGSIWMEGVWQQQRIPLPEAVIDITTYETQQSIEKKWLGQHTMLIAMDMPVEYEEIYLGLQKSPLLCALVKLGPEEHLYRPGSKEYLPPLEKMYRFRIRMSCSIEGRWMTDSIELRKDVVPSNAEETTLERDIHSFLLMEFPDSHMFIVAHLMHKASEVAMLIQSLNSSRLPSIYVDLTIDGQRDTRFCGAGIGRDELERMSLAMAYAKQLAEDGRNAPFQPHANDSSFAGHTIGMLMGWPLSPLFLEACHYVAQSNGARFFYFYPRNVDFKKKQIRGSFRQDGKWIEADFSFPDVIYDRMRRRNDEYASFYQALSDIPITHELKFGASDKITVYQVMVSESELVSAVIPFQMLNHPDRVRAFIDSHPSVILKRKRGTHGKDSITVNRMDGHYEVFDQNFLHFMSREEFDDLLRELKKHHFFVQQFVNSRTKEGFPFHIRVHLMKDGSGKWVIIFIFPSFSLRPYMKITNHEKTFRGVTKWEWFIGSQFGERLDGVTDSKVKAFSYRFTDFLESWLGKGFHEVGLDLGIDEHGDIKLFEANLNNVGMNFHEFEAAKHGIEYALLLASGK